MSTFHIDTGTKAGTLGGTFLSILINVPSQDIFKTIILAGVGAAVSFTVSMLMKLILQWIRRKTNKKFPSGD